MRKRNTSTIRKFLIMSSALAIMLTAAGCNNKTDEKTTSELNSKTGSNSSSTSRITKENGNSVGNIANSGLALKMDDWIFYCDPNRDSLNKMKTDGTDNTKIIDGSSFFELNRVGDWIYCSDKDGYRCYKIKADGTQSKRLTDCQCYDINVAGDSIYFISEDSRVCKMDLNGKNITRLNNEESCRLNVVDGWVYFCKITDHPSSETYNDNFNNDDWLPCGKIYKMRTDGSGVALVCDSDCSFVNVDDGWIYYSDVKDRFHMYKIKTDGTAKTKICDDGCYGINVSDDAIYYSNITMLGVVYRIDRDGKGRAPVGEFDGKCWKLNKAGDYLFFNYTPNGPGEPGFYMVKTDGSEKTIVY